MTTSDSYADGSRTVHTGQVIRVKGHRGRFVFHGADLTAGSFDCYGGCGDRRMWRTFPLDRLGAVDREATRRRMAEA